MLNLKELIDMGCAHTMVDSDGWMHPCGRPIVAIRHWPDYGDGDGYSGVCQQHARQAGAELAPLKTFPIRRNCRSTSLTWTRMTTTRPTNRR